MSGAASTAPILSAAEMWRAVEARDRAADGLFFFGVTTTRIYCRPSCPARRPRREHALFFETAEHAQRAGLRACLRCRPDEALDAALALCEAVLAQVERQPAARWSDAALRARGFDPVQVRRAFLAQFGRTFHEHLRGIRVGKARTLVAGGLDPVDAGARTGFDSESGLRAAFRAELDTTPARAADCATLEWTRFASPLGLLTAAATKDGVCLLEFDLPENGAQGPGEHARTSLRRVAERLGARLVAASNPHLDRLRLELDQWFGREREEFEVPLVFSGTPFENEVWRKLGSIPYGETWSYGQLARELGRPKAARAVGRANSMNPIAILVPCHRVIGASGQLTGYAGGLDRKRWLLAHEYGVR